MNFQSLKLFILSFLLIVCFQKTLDAQVTRSVIKEAEVVDVSNSYIGAFFGVSVPIDQFSSNKLKENSGFAKSHIKINVDGAYVIARNLGVAGSLGYFVNGNNSVDYFSQFKENFTPDENAITSSQWRNTYFAVGPFFSLPESKLYFDGRALIGVNRTRTPLLRLRGDTDITRFSEKVWSPAIIVGFGVGYRITPQWRLVLQSEYFTAAPKLSAEHTIIENNFEQNTKNSYRQRITHFALSLGMQLDLTANKERRRK